MCVSYVHVFRERNIKGPMYLLFLKKNPQNNRKNLKLCTQKMNCFCFIRSLANRSRGMETETTRGEKVEGAAPAEKRTGSDKVRGKDPHPVWKLSNQQVSIVI